MKVGGSVKKTRKENSREPENIREIEEREELMNSIP